MPSSLSSFDMLSSHLSVMHLIIQSLQPKIDFIRCEAHAYDILVFTESWLKPQVSNDSIRIDSFAPLHTMDRHGRPGGGVAMYVRDFFTCKRMADLEIHGLETVWLEPLVQSEQILVGGFYRPPHSGAEYFNLVVESIDRAHNNNITDLIILVDFNYNMLTDDNNKITDIMLHYNLSQVIKDALQKT